jgi:hypothetical protein
LGCANLGVDFFVLGGLVLIIPGVQSQFLLKTGWLSVRFVRKPIEGGSRGPNLSGTTCQDKPVISSRE